MWTEAWVKAWADCPHCGHTTMSQFPNNSLVADFLCGSCSEEFELKSQKGKFGTKVADGAYKTKCERLVASNNPNLLLMNYNLKSLAVRKSFHRSKALLRSRHHRRTQTSRGNRAPRRLDRIEYSDR
jgi:type II restriction enzyme